MQLSKNHHVVKSAALESLECRRHFIIAFYSLARLYSDGVLSIEGTSESDTIVLSKSGSNLKVVGSSSTKTFTFPSASVNKVIVSLYAGDDKFTSDNSVTKPMNVDGNFGKDTITTGGGDDSIFSGNEDDKVYGGNGKDTIQGGSGNDTIDGQGNDDSLEAGPGNDKVYGGVGKDTLDAVGTGADLYDGGDGFDAIYYGGRTTGVVVTNDGIANDGKKPSSGYNSVEKDNVLPNVEKISTTRYADIVKLTGNIVNEIYGKDGNDTLYGGPGNDYIDGDIGGDLIDGEGGNDKIYGFSGDDFLLGGAGDDKIYGEYDRDRISGDSGNDTISGGDQGDTIYGDDGNDVLSGDSGDDYFSGGIGNDILVGGAGFDSFHGDAGNDIIYANDGIFNEIVDGGTNFDTAYIDRIFAYPQYIPGDLPISIEQLYLV